MQLARDIVAEPSPPPRTTGELRFRAMGSDAHVIVVGGHRGLTDQARRRIDDLERLWSRFLPDSEVCELTRRAGTSVPVSEETALLVRRAIDAWRLTGGSFDPTVLGDIVRAGYDRSFDEVVPAPAIGHSFLMTGCADIALGDGTVRLPPATGFDPGGIGKGLAADLVVEDLLAGGAAGACVNLGGDLRVSGDALDGRAWTVAIEHPWSATPVAHLGLSHGAVATSTTLRRRWEVDGQTYHHLIDPATGEPSDSDLTLASVVCGSAWEAEVLAKAVLLRGSAHPFDLLGGTDAEALVVDDRGRIQSSPGLTAFLGAAELPAILPTGAPGVDR